MAADPKDTLTERAAELLTEAGYLNALAELHDALAFDELTRDKISAKIGAKQCLKPFAEAREEKLRSQEHQQLLAEMRQIRESMKKQGSGGTNFSEDQIRIPRRPSKGSPKK